MKRILVIAILLLGCALAYFVKVNIDLNKRTSDQALNIKSLEKGVVSYKDKFGRMHSETIEQNKTIDELKNSKDSASIAFIQYLKDSKIKLKNVTGTGTISTSLVSEKQIAFNSKDTIIDLSEKPHLTEIITIKDNNLSRYLKITNKQDLVHHTKRETIKPPKKFFLARWLQKRHDVTYVDIMNSNPLITTTNQKFVIVTK